MFKRLWGLKCVCHGHAFRHICKENMSSSRVGTKSTCGGLLTSFAEMYVLRNLIQRMASGGIWSERVVCAVLGPCRKNVVATIKGVFFFSSLPPVTFLPEGVVHLLHHARVNPCLRLTISSIHCEMS